jgi:hypothetical protein
LQAVLAAIDAGEIAADLGHVAICGVRRTR